MSRSGYIDDDGEGDWALIMWRGAVASAIRGKRGQALLKETLAALDAMPEKTLAKDSLVTANGSYCTLGVLGVARGIPMGEIDPDDCNHVARIFGVAPALVREIVDQNDSWYGETAEKRFTRMRSWIAGKIKESNEQT